MGVQLRRAGIFDSGSKPGLGLVEPFPPLAPTVVAERLQVRVIIAGERDGQARFAGAGMRGKMLFQFFRQGRRARIALVEIFKKERIPLTGIVVQKPQNGLANGVNMAGSNDRPQIFGTSQAAQTDQIQMLAAPKNGPAIRFPIQRNKAQKLTAFFVTNTENQQFAGGPAPACLPPRRLPIVARENVGVDRIVRKFIPVGPQLAKGLFISDDFNVHGLYGQRLH